MAMLDLNADTARAMLVRDNLNEEEQAYLDYHAERIAFLVNLIARQVAAYGRDGHGPARVMDVGPHFLTTALRRRLGPDLTLNTLGWANPRLVPPGIVDNHFQYDLNNAQDRERWLAPTPHDIIVMAEVIEHLYTAPRLVLSFLATFLDARGVLIIQTPNAVSIAKRVKMLRGQNPYEMIREARDNPGHFREYTADELRALCTDASLTCKEIFFAHYWRGGAVSRLLERVNPHFRQGLTVMAQKTGVAPGASGAHGAGSPGQSRPERARP